MVRPGIGATAQEPYRIDLQSLISVQDPKKIRRNLQLKDVSICRVARIEETVPLSGEFLSQVE